MTMDATTRVTTHRFVPADFLTPGYRVVGKILVPSMGATGVMNDTTNSFLEVFDARLARVHMPTKLVDHYEAIQLVKRQVFAICLGRREDIGPQAVARGGYARVVPYEVRITSSVYELEGVVEWPGRFDFKAIMVEGKSDFVPLYDAKLTAILIPTLKLESPAVLFNRQHVDLMGLLSQRAKPKE